MSKSELVIDNRKFNYNLYIGIMIQYKYNKKFIKNQLHLFKKLITIIFQLTNILY